MSKKGMTWQGSQLVPAAEPEGGLAGESGLAGQISSTKPESQIPGNEQRSIRIDGSPIQRISDILVSVAEGGPMTPVQSVLTDIIKPMTTVQRAAFLAQIRRWKDATERVYQMAQTQIAGG